jgi:hypothetical protein
VDIAVPNYCIECKPEGVKEHIPNSHIVGEKLHLGKPTKTRKK